MIGIPIIGIRVARAITQARQLLSGRSTLKCLHRGCFICVKYFYGTSWVCRLGFQDGWSGATLNCRNFDLDHFKSGLWPFYFKNKSQRTRGSGEKVHGTVGLAWPFFSVTGSHVHAHWRGFVSGAVVFEHFFGLNVYASILAISLIPQFIRS